MEKNEAKEVNKFVTTLLNCRGHIKKKKGKLHKCNKPKSKL